MENVLSKQDVKASQGHIIDQGKLTFWKVQALNHTKSRKMVQTRSVLHPFYPFNHAKVNLEEY